MSLVKTNGTIFPSFLNEILNTDWYGGYQGTEYKQPPVNIFESTEGYIIELLVPGRKQKDFEIEVNEGKLGIATLDASEGDKDGRYTRREFSYLSSFKRVFNLPKNVSDDKIEAMYENGILKFNLPLKEEALPKPKRVISLK